MKQLEQRPSTFAELHGGQCGWNRVGKERVWGDEVREMYMDGVGKGVSCRTLKAMIRTVVLSLREWGATARF